MKNWGTKLQKNNRFYLYFFVFSEIFLSYTLYFIVFKFAKNDFKSRYSILFRYILFSNASYKTFPHPFWHSITSLAGTLNNGLFRFKVTFAIWHLLFSIFFHIALDQTRKSRFRLYFKQRALLLNRKSCLQSYFQTENICFGLFLIKEHRFQLYF